jgi:hypothetical protein
MSCRPGLFDCNRNIKKQQHCDPGDPADSEQGDNWDHVAFDPTHRLVVSVVPGKRTAVKTDALVQDVHRRTGGCILDLMVSDEYPATSRRFCLPMVRRLRRRVPVNRVGPRSRILWPQQACSMRQCTRPDTRGAWSMWNRVLCLARRKPLEQRWQLHP